MRELVLEEVSMVAGGYTPGDDGPSGVLPDGGLYGGGGLSLGVGASIYCGGGQCHGSFLVGVGSNVTVGVAQNDASGRARDLAAGSNIGVGVSSTTSGSVQQPYAQGGIGAGATVPVVTKSGD